MITLFFSVYDSHAILAFHGKATPLPRGRQLQFDFLSDDRVSFSLRSRLDDFTTFLISQGYFVSFVPSETHFFSDDESGHKDEHKDE